MMRGEALILLGAHSEAEYRRLLDLHEKDKIFYTPNQSDLHVWELEVSRDQRTYTRLFVTKDIALRWAAEDIKPKHIVWDSGYTLNEKLFKWYNEGKYEEIVEWINQHYANTQYRLRSVVVSAG